MAKNWFRWALVAMLVGGCQSMAVFEPREPSWVKDRPQLGVRLRVVSAESLPATIVGKRSQVLRVVKVRPDSPAQRAGLLQGDTLLWLDGKAISSMQDSVAAMESKDPREALVLVIERDGELQTLNVDMTKKDTTEDIQPEAVH